MNRTFLLCIALGAAACRPLPLFYVEPAPTARHAAVELRFVPGGSADLYIEGKVLPVGDHERLRVAPGESRWRFDAARSLGFKEFESCKVDGFYRLDEGREYEIAMMFTDGNVRGEKDRRCVLVCRDMTDASSPAFCPTVTNGRELPTAR